MRLPDDCRGTRRIRKTHILLRSAPEITSDETESDRQSFWGVGIFVAQSIRCHVSEQNPFFGYRSKVVHLLRGNFPECVRASLVDNTFCAMCPIVVPMEPFDPSNLLVDRRNPGILVFRWRSVMHTPDKVLFKLVGC